MSRFERLSPHHSIQSFVSGNADLDGWLRDAGETADRAGTARVYIWSDGADGVIGYFAILPHNILREEVPSSVGRGAPNVIPGFLLARLALSEHLHGGGRGGELLVGALDTTLAAIRIGGGRVIVVDAINDRARGFYEHFGFRPIPADPNRLVMKASTAATSLSLEWP
ncbi:MAG: N-acetyltransferase [Actinomycetota bacterium]|nr:N-acetyltransferase [Actinomycetota bacterium]